MNDLVSVWNRQRAYNDAIKAQEDLSKEEWAVTYMMGIVAEMDELLREINWKKHRKKSSGDPNRLNIGFEIADMTKYIFSLWQLWGFGIPEMLEIIGTKSDMLHQQLMQDHIVLLPEQKILITDLDGTVANWRSSFIKWIREQGIDPVIDDPVTTLMIDYDLALRYPQYVELKDQFESSGMYEHLLPYGDAITTINNLKLNMGVHVIANTARPFSKYKRIWMDTWRWIEKNGIMIDELNMAYELRIMNAHSLNKKDNVIMFEDDPELIIRGANSGIRVFARRHPYNESISHKNVVMVDKYTDLKIEDYFPEGG